MKKEEWIQSSVIRGAFIRRAFSGVVRVLFEPKNGDKMSLHFLGMSKEENSKFDSIFEQIDFQDSDSLPVRQEKVDAFLERIEKLQSFE